MAPKVWLITGTSSGFGLELARCAARRGDRVIAASRSPQKLAHLETEGIKPIRLDHNEPLPQIQAAMNDALAIYGTIDVVVNNAAYVHTGVLEEVTTEEALQQYQANLFGPLNLYRALLPHLREKGSGTLITIGSMAAWFAMPGCNLYNSSKAALRIMTLGLAEEVAQFGIKHCLVEPGFFRTGLLDPTANFVATKDTKRLPAYANINATTDSGLAAYNGAQLGNPVRGAEIIYDVATSSGCAAGREFPGFLPLGSDACDVIQKSASQTLADVDKWRDISSQSDFPKGQ
ncbi:short chain dehydrogenase [Aspergillus sclerotialis]|uniref:Short chain dehydrogenase n=1 Tax=Aspergillus sclerotialis TaxID=2070753 RepID=A0A3A2ZLE5_9EURO|nr:short chain dehydrogenase [Aspergillus sclerotialis]